MRHSILVAAVIAALATAAPASASLSLARTQAWWFPLRHTLVVQASWTPATTATDVSLAVSNGSSLLRTLRAPHWLIGTKTFRLLLPRTLATGSVLTARLHLHSSEGTVKRTLHITVS
jgi:hypothetical protein